MYEISTIGGLGEAQAPQLVTAPVVASFVLGLAIGGALALIWPRRRRG